MSKKIRRHALSPKEATDEIRQRAHHDYLDLYLTMHAKKRMKERDIIQGDILEVLETGTVWKEGQNASKAGFHSYVIQGGKMHATGREIAVVVIIESEIGASLAIKVKTVMWVDETQTYGTLVGNPN